MLHYRDCKILFLLHMLQQHMPTAVEVCPLFFLSKMTSSSHTMSSVHLLTLTITRNISPHKPINLSNIKPNAIGISLHINDCLLYTSTFHVFTEHYYTMAVLHIRYYAANTLRMQSLKNSSYRNFSFYLFLKGTHCFSVHRLPKLYCYSPNLQYKITSSLT